MKESIFYYVSLLTRATIIYTTFLFLTSCATHRLSPEEQSKISLIYNTDGCEPIGSFVGKDNFSSSNAQTKAIKQALSIGANAYAGGPIWNDFTTQYAKLFAYKCSNLANNGPTYEQIQQEQKSAQQSNELRQQNMVNSLQQFNKTMFNKPVQKRNPAKTKCRTVKRDYMGKTQYETICQ